jgi:uncharacterized protein YjbI with pentapeptide repeats
MKKDERTKTGLLPPKLPKQLQPVQAASLENGANLSEGSLISFDFTGEAATGVHFEAVHCKRASFLQTKLVSARFLDVRFEMCELSAADWENARFRRVEFLGCRLLAVQIPGGSFEDVLFEDCKGEGAYFALAAFQNARFAKCSLKGARFEGADLSGVVFHECDLQDADFRNAKLSGADLRGCNINGIQVGIPELRGAILDPQQALQVIGLLGVQVWEKGEDLC